MSRPNEITKKLQGADPELSSYVKALEKENRRLHDKIGRLGAKITTKDNEIKKLKKMQPEEIKIIFQEPPQTNPDTPLGVRQPAETQPYKHPQPDIPGKPIQITK
jgi:hypothetical protein